MGSHAYGGWEVPRPTADKLETPRAGGEVPVQKPSGSRPKKSWLAEVHPRWGGQFALRYLLCKCESHSETPSQTLRITQRPSQVDAKWTVTLTSTTQALRCERQREHMHVHAQGAAPRPPGLTPAAVGNFHISQMGQTEVVMNFLAGQSGPRKITNTFALAHKCHLTFSPTKQVDPSDQTSS